MRFSTDRQPADRPTREGVADLRKHPQPPSDNTGHHGSGSPLNLRVRGSSPWRRTTSDLAFCGFSPACPRYVVGPKQANACKKRAALARIAAAVRNLRVRDQAQTVQRCTASWDVSRRRAPPSTRRLLRPPTCPPSPRSSVRAQAHRMSYHCHTDRISQPTPRRLNESIGHELTRRCIQFRERRSNQIVNDIDLSLSTRGHGPVIPQLPGYRTSDPARV
jgi:hypothetical protein